MIILGINEGFDAGAAIIKDGKIIAAINEERISRVKFHTGHFNGWPYKSVKHVLKLAKITPKDVDFVAVASIVDSPLPARIKGFYTKGKNTLTMNVKASWLKKKAFNFFCDQESDSLVGQVSKSVIKPYFKTFLSRLGINDKPIYFVEHHHAHAAGAYYTGNKKKVLVVTMDGHGDGLSGAIAIFDGKHIKRIAKTASKDSVGWFYSQITHTLGFKMHRHEGKITGLAAFGKKNSPAYHILKKSIDVDLKNLRTVNNLGYKYDGLDKLQKIVNAFPREDVAGAAQQRFEEVITELIAAAVKRTGITDIVTSGGDFANVRLNQKIRELPGVTSFFVHPHMGDGGLSTGAALAMWGEFASNPKPIPLETVYFGDEFSDAQIEAELKKSGLEYKKYKNVEKAVAKLLANGKVVARFNGRMEYGPRALGNRTILADPTDASINDWLNKRLNRTEFMPFAPVVLHEMGDTYFKNYSENEYPCSFMTMTLDAKPAAKKCKAVIHVDGTARPQGIKESQNPSYYKILKEYYKLTGLGMLVNTSFNMHEEPIVHTPHDAIRSFNQGCVEALAIGSFIVEQDLGR